MIRGVVAGCLSVFILAAWAGAVSQAGGSVLAGRGGARESARVDLVGAVDEYLTRAVPFGFSGVVLLAKGGRVVLKKGYGLADRKGGVPFTTETVYNIESITKQFTAAAILKLEEQGKLRTADPLTKYFEDVPADKAAVTLHQLLTHTAGLPGSSGDDYEPVGRDAVVRRILESKLRWAPGTKWAYSNPGYTLLAVVVEKVSGRPYEVFVREQLLRPAGMQSTGYTLPDWKTKRLARSYDGERDLGTPLDHPWAADGPWWNLRGGGGMLSTVEDLYRWHLALRRHAVLSEAAQARAMTSYALTTRPETHYGYAWFVSRDARGRLLVEHGGDGLFMAEFRRYLDEDVVLILGVNHRQRDLVAGPARRQVVRLAAGAEVKLPPKAALALPRARLKEYAGTYRLPSGEEFGVAVDGGQLVVDTEATGAAKLFIQLPRAQRAERLQGLTPSIAGALEGVARGDFEPLRAIFRPDLNFKEETAYWTDTWPSWRKRLGAFEGSEVLGASPEADSPDIYVLIKFERGSRLARFNRNADGRFYIDTDPTPLLPPRYRFVPLSKTEFVSYNFGTTSEVRITFQMSGRGAVRGMTVQGGPSVSKVK